MSDIKTNTKSSELNKVPNEILDIKTSIENLGKDIIDMKKTNPSLDSNSCAFEEIIKEIGERELRKRNLLILDKRE